MWLSKIPIIRDFVAFFSLSDEPRLRAAQKNDLFWIGITMLFIGILFIVVDLIG